MNLCSRESACTASRLHHNRKIRYCAAQDRADARCSARVERPPRITSRTCTALNRRCIPAKPISVSIEKRRVSCLADMPTCFRSERDRLPPALDDAEIGLWAGDCCAETGLGLRTSFSYAGLRSTVGGLRMILLRSQRLKIY